MSGVYKDRAWCSRSVEPQIKPHGEGCCRESCDRYVTTAVQRAAQRAKLSLDLHDLRTGICGYLPREEAK